MEANISVKLGSLVVAAVLLGLSSPAAVRAQESGLYGPSGDFPDASLVMPFAATGDRTAFFAISNLEVTESGTVPVEVTWDFYDQDGALLVSVSRFTFGEAGTDIVDVSAVASKSVDGVVGPPTDLSGRNGMVVVSKDENPDLIGNWTQANVQSLAGFGANAAGLGHVGFLEPRDLFGTSFAPSSLEDDLLMVLGVNDLDFPPTSLTDGAPAGEGETVFSFEIGLYDNAVGQIAIAEVPVSGTAYFASLREMFPGYDLNKSITINLRPITEGVSLIAFYGQTLGAFGAGQSLRTDLYSIEE